MNDWTVRRWARFGHERLYVENGAGEALGHFDLKMGEYQPADPAHLPSLVMAISDYLADAQIPLEPHLPVDEVPPAEPVVTEPTWNDLSAVRAGAAARERALEERATQGRFVHAVSRLVGARTDERAWRIGADGEEAVADQLRKLGPSWRTIHAIPVGNRGSDIDHVVIGPGGVFTINAKHHPQASVWVGGDTFMVNGQRVPYIRNSRHEARRAGRLLSAQVGFDVSAIGVIAVMGARKGYTIKK